jgi:integrase
MPGRWSNGRATKLLPDKQISNHALHDWWYGCLVRAGVVPEGTTKGERMHKARHTAGQNMLDATGNLKAVQKLLGTPRC